MSDHGDRDTSYNDTSDDFSDTEKVFRAWQDVQWRLGGGECPASSDLNDTEDLELEGEVIDEQTPSKAKGKQRSNGGNSRACSNAQKKMGGRVVPDDSNDEGSDGDNIPGPRKAGRIPKLIRKQSQALFMNFCQQIEALAIESGHLHQMLMLASGG
ncbi:hypothetical protein K439DRAFT_1615041 [Ramaria rubella]|nr:hypothetical protein K439DRAFT_1615041 [Ramaria rubella]